MHKTTAQQKALKTLSWAVFILFAMPKLSVRVGPVPIYIIDIFLFVAYLQSWRLRKLTNSKFKVSGVIYFVSFLIIFSELYAAIILGTFLEPIYQSLRTFLALSVFFSTSRIINSKNDIIKISSSALFGAVISASLLILTSVPFTRGLVTSTIFSITFLEPGFDEELLELSSSGTRGRSLIGVSILSGAFLNTVWPLILYLRGATHLKKYTLQIQLTAILIPIGVVMTYSRGAILGLLLVILGIVFYNGGKSRGIIIGGVVTVLLIFSTVGWNSEVFYFERLTKSTARIFEEGEDTRSEAERKYAYTEPFEHLVKNPLFLFFGEGLAKEKIGSNRLTAGRGMATHAVFAKAYYAYGMIVALLYLFLLVYAFVVTLAYSNKKLNSATSFSRALLASLLGLFPWYMLGHAAVSTPRGAIMLFFVFGLVSAQSNIHYSERYKAWFFKVKWPKIKAMRQRQIPKQKELAEAS